MSIQKHKLLFDASFFHKSPSGIATDSRDFLEAFIYAGFNVELLHPLHSEGKKDTQFSVHQDPIPDLMRKFSLLTVGKVFHAIYSDAQTYFCPQPSALQPNYKKMTVMTRIHDIYPISNPEWFNLTTNRYFKNALKESIKSDLLICNSDTTKRELNKYYPETKDTSIVVPCLAKETVEFGCGRCILCQGAKIPKNFLLTIGTFEPRKNIPNMITAWKARSVKKMIYPDLKLVLVGTQKWKYRSSVSAIESVRDGSVMALTCCNFQLSQLLLKARGYISATLSEGFNIPAHYAFKRGMRLLLSDIPVHREFFSSVPTYFNPQNVEEITAAIKKFTEDLQIMDLNLVPRVETRTLLDIGPVVTKLNLT